MISQKVKLRLYKTFLSFLGTGYAPFAPGTFGSLATLPLMWLISLNPPSTELYVSFLIILTIIACLITEVVQKKEKVFDPSWIVIDETIGMLFTWLVCYPRLNLTDGLIIFICFRFFDILKFWPASYFDKKVKNGAGTILDDVLSAGYAVIASFYLLKFIN